MEAIARGAKRSDCDGGFTSTSQSVWLSSSFIKEEVAAGGSGRRQENKDGEEEEEGEEEEKVDGASSSSTVNSQCESERSALLTAPLLTNDIKLEIGTLVGEGRIDLTADLLRRRSAFR